MFELDKFDGTRLGQPLALPEARSSEQSARRSLLVWGEHCIECTAPTCFSTCDLYEPRSDGRCRRFTFGIHEHKAVRGSYGSGAEVEFKKWAKLESRGNTLLRSAAELRWLERALGGLGFLAEQMGRAVYAVSGDIRWRYVRVSLLDRLLRFLHRRARAERGPDAFVVEIFNPDRKPVSLQLAMSIAKNEISVGHTVVLPSFRTTLAFPPGLSKHVVPSEQFENVTEAGLPFDIALVPDGETNPRLVFVAADFVRLEKPLAPARPAEPTRPAVKCVVWDLDNTLWPGILLENDAVTIRPGLKELLVALDQRGILLSVSSKNDFASAMAKLEAFGLREFFLYPQIGWFQKSQGIKRIAERLNIGLDTFAFIDDNPFELEEVARALPTVTCIEVGDIGSLLENRRFQGSDSDEARRRRSMYKEAEQRDEEQHRFGEDYFAFLRSCAIVLEIAPYSPENAERIGELVQRTNQLNFSGKKYARDEIEPFLGDPAVDKFVLSCSDKYGSYGIVGFAMATCEARTIRIQDLMLSCRVQGKFVEQAFLSALARLYRSDDECAIWVNFQSTGRNVPARAVLESIGFTAAQGSGMELHASKETLECDFIDVTMSVRRRELTGT